MIVSEGCRTSRRATDELPRSNFSSITRRTSPSASTHTSAGIVDGVASRCCKICRSASCSDGGTSAGRSPSRDRASRGSASSRHRESSRCRPSSRRSRPLRGTRGICVGSLWPSPGTAPAAPSFGAESPTTASPPMHAHRATHGSFTYTTPSTVRTSIAAREDTCRGTRRQCIVTRESPVAKSVTPVAVERDRVAPSPLDSTP